MGADLLRDALARLATARRITPQDALEVRRAIFADANLNPVEAETLIALDEAAQERCPEWDALFCEALTDFVVYQQEPRGYVDDAGADWVIAMLGRDGRVRSDSELDLLIHILEAADGAPRKLVNFALAQVKDAVINGEGPLARSGRLQQGVMSAAEVALLKRILYAQAGDSNVAITRDEAEALIDINDAVSGAANDPSWNDLFAKAIGAAVMTVSGYQPVSRDEAKRLNAWLETPETLGSFFGRMFTGERDWSLAGLWRVLSGHDQEEADWVLQNAREEAAMSAAEPVSQGEAEWLASRIGRDDVFDAAEKALIQFLREESPDIHPALQALLDGQAAHPDEATPAVFGKRVAG